jgi:hypothetical protein
MGYSVAPVKAIRANVGLSRRSWSNPAESVYVWPVNGHGIMGV